MSSELSTSVSSASSRNTLPCRHQVQVMRQIAPAIDLLRRLDELYPDILHQHTIEPADYHGGLVFRSAIESLRGTYISSSAAGREGYINDILANLKQRSAIADFQRLTSRQRCDFEIVVDSDNAYNAALEIKGGEGNSINISVRSKFVQEFAVWCHLDGAIVNQPAHGAHSILNRLTNEMSARNKHVDVLFFKDMLCGTRARPCPKYLGQEYTIGREVAPDVFLFPREIPTLQNPNPSVHQLDNLKLPKLFLDYFRVPPEQYVTHVWEVHMELVERHDRRLQRLLRVMHLGQQVDESRGRPFIPTEQ